MEELVFYIGLAAVIGYFVGYHLRGIQMIRLLSENPEHFMRVLEQVRRLNQDSNDSTTESVAVELEVHNSHYYAFNKTNGEFLGQGATVVEALKQAADRFPGVSFGASELSKIAKQVDVRKPRRYNRYS